MSQTVKKLHTPRRQGGSRVGAVLGRLGLFFISISVFILALLIMKEGAYPLTPWIRDNLSVDSPASALGFGWLSANVALSGSPVAAASLVFLDAEVLSPVESFAMIAGSRLGAAFLVLLVGFIFMLRGKQRVLSLSVGLLSLLVTQTLYPPVLFLGFFLLSNGWLDSLQIHTDQRLDSPVAVFFDPIVHTLKRSLPEWFLLPLGFILVILALWLFDRIIPNLHFSEAEVSLVQQQLFRPAVTFLIGAGVTLLTMSVSVSLGLLVPLSVKGYMRRENVIPYILGANITTFIDTLIAAALLANPAAVTVVLVQMVSVAIVSLIILATSYRFYQSFVERAAEFISQKRRYLAMYISIIFIIPFLLIILG